MAAKYYKLNDEECSIICALLKHHAHEYQELKNILIRLREHRILSDDEVASYNKATEEIVKINSIFNKLIV